MKEAMLYRKLLGQKVQCGLCYRRCLIGEGERGYCLSRLNVGGTLYSLVYGVISAMEATPIEEKPLIRFHPGTRCLSVGTFGCNFRCKGCQNHEISWGREELDLLAEQALRGNGPEAVQGKVGSDGFQYLAPDRLVQKALDLGCEGVAFTYNEPTIWLEYVLEVAEGAKQAGLYTVYVTNSWFTPEQSDVLAPCIDAMALDIKSLDDAYYEELCDVKLATGRVLQTCADACNHHGIHVETRTCIVPGYNDDPDMLGRIAVWIRDHLGEDSTWHILRFFPKHRLTEIPPTPEESLKAAQRIGRETGLKHVNVVADKSCD